MDFDDLIPGGSASTLSFDDLIPSASSSAISFDDLIPGATDGTNYMQSVASGATPLPSGQGFEGNAATMAKNAGDRYNQSATLRDLSSLGKGIVGGALNDPYAQEEQNIPLSVPGVGDITLADLRANGGTLGNTAANLLHGAHSLIRSIYTGAGNIKDKGIALYNQDSAAQKAASDKYGAEYAAADPETRRSMDEAGIPSAPSQLPQAVLGGATVGAAQGLYNAAKPLVSGGVRVIGDVTGDALRLAGDKSDAAQMQSQLDYGRLAYDKNIEQPALDKADNATGFPELAQGVANVLPAVVPVVGGLESAPLAAKIGGAVEGGLGKAIPAVTGRTLQGIGATGEYLADAAPTITGAGMLSTMWHGGAAALPAAAGEAVLGGIAKAAKPLATGIKNYGQSIATSPATGGMVQDARIAGQVVGAGVNAGAAITTGALYGLGGAEPGQEEEGARSGAAVGAVASPLSIIAGGYTRQKAEQLAENSRLAGRGAVAYGTSPDLDTQHAAGMDTLSPEDQAMVNANRGYLRSLNTANGDPLQVYVQTPQDFADGATAVNGGQVANAANAQGYYRDGTGKIFLNADHPDVPGALTNALGHEASHAAFQDALPQVSPGLASSFTDSIHNSALDSAGQPTSQFQQFMDGYAGKPVDWSSLPADAPTGASKQYYLQELGAQTGAAVNGSNNPAAFTLKPEASDVVGNALGDFLRKAGIKQGPDVGVGKAPYIPAAATALQKARQAYQILGQSADTDAPVQAATAAATQPSTATSAPAEPWTNDSYGLGAGFLPASKAGTSTPAQVASASRQWARRGTESPFFKNWFGGSAAVDEQGQPLNLYHGSPALLKGGFDSFKVPQDAGDLLAGSGIYLTDNKKLGQTYTVNRDDLLAGAGNMVDPQSVPANTPVMSLYANIRKPFDAGAGGLEDTRRIVAAELARQPPEPPLKRRDGTLSSPPSPEERASDLVDNEARLYPTDEPLRAYKVLRETLSNEGIIRNGRQAPGDELRSILEANGFDGIKHVGGVMGGQQHNVWIAFKPEQVKSATANNGQFDPASANVNFLPRYQGSALPLGGPGDYNPLTAPLGFVPASRDDR